MLRAAWKGYFFHSAVYAERTNKWQAHYQSPASKISSKASIPLLDHSLISPTEPRPHTQQSQRRPGKQAGTGLLPETLTWARPAGSP